MTVVLAVSGRHAQLVLDCLRTWSASGYVAPFVWAGPTGEFSLVAAGASKEQPLGEALAKDGNAFVVGVASPQEDGWISGRAYDHVASVQRALEGVVAVAPAPSLVLLPLDDSTRIEPPREGLVRSTLVVVPEDCAGPGTPNVFDPADDEAVGAHIAHAVVCLSGLLAARRNDAPLVPERNAMADLSGAVSVVRCHSRIIDAGFLADALAVRAFTSAREGWPSPDSTHCERGTLDAGVLATLSKRFLSKHRDVLGVRDVPMLATPEPPRLSLLQALRAIGRFFISELRRRPYEWFDQRMERLWDGVVVTSVERLGAGSGVRVVRWRDSSTGATGMEHLASRLPHLVPAPDGAVGPAWRDLVVLTTSLIDAHEPPLKADELVREQRRQLETRPSRLVPDPRELPPVEDRPQNACDPAALDTLIPRILDAPQGSDSGSAGEHGDPPGEVGDNGDSDIDLAARNALLAQLREWYEERSATLLWQVGRGIADALANANEAAIGPTQEEWTQLDEQVSEGRNAATRRNRRRRRWLFGRSVAGAAIATWVVVGHIPTIVKPIGLLAIFLGWFLLLVRSWWRARKWGSRRERELQQATEQLLHRAVVAAVRRGDKERLERRYREYLDWAEVIGHLVHRPWVARATSYGQPEHFPSPLKPEALPAASEVAYSLYTDVAINRLAARPQAAVFRPSWLTDLVDDVIQHAAADWSELHAARGSESDAKPDPFGDTSVDPDNLRTHVLEFVRLGRERSIDKSSLAREYMDRLSDERMSSVLTEVFDAATSEERPLPPAAEWFSRPEGLDELVANVRDCVVSIYGAGRWIGSGVLIDNVGTVATCRHCVEGTPRGAFAVATGTGVTSPAELVGIAADNDVALIRVTSEAAFPAATLGSADELEQGFPVFTLGYPFFSPQTGGPSVAWGVVTAPRRDVMGDHGALETRIQTNYPAGGGASGSPVFNLRGEVIGIHTGGYSHPGYEERSSHISFAVPVERLRQLIVETGGEDRNVLAVQPPSAGRTREGTPVDEFLAPILTGETSYLRAHGTLSTRAREIVATHFSPPSIAPRNHTGSSASDIPLGETLVQPISVGSALRAVVIRIDQTEIFHVGRRGATGLPWFAPPPSDDGERDAPREPDDSDDGFGSL